VIYKIALFKKGNLIPHSEIIVRNIAKPTMLIDLFFNWLAGELDKLINVEGCYVAYDKYNI